MYNKVIKSKIPPVGIRVVGGNLSPSPPPLPLPQKPQSSSASNYQKGFEEGKREGLRLGRDEVAQVVSQLKAISGAILEAKKEIINQAQREVVELALAIAKRVVRANVQVNKEIIINMVEETLRRTVDRERIVIRVNPSDVEVIKSNRSQYTSSIEGIENLEIVADRRVSPGGCVVETNTGSVVADIDAQLEEIKEKLIGS